MGGVGRKSNQKWGTKMKKKGKKGGNRMGVAVPTKKRIWEVLL